MRHLSALVLTLPVAAMQHGCSTSGTTTNSPQVSPSNREVMADDFESPPPHTTVSEVMRAKLAHAQAILEGLALNDTAQVEANAVALKRISQGGDWLVQDTESYFALSSEFRAVCDDLVAHATTQNVGALSRDYTNLVNSCVACHDYLRRERAVKDLPGRISHIDPVESLANALKGAR